MEDEEIIITIFKDFIRQYEKSNTINVGMLPNGENVIYAKIKMTGRQKEFMKDYVERRIKIMEEEIQDKLEEIYNFSIDVKFKDFRMYDIYCRIDHEKAFCISILYDAKSTLDANITNIKQKINNEIIELYLK